jgi:hypothetical protein
VDGAPHVKNELEAAHLLGPKTSFLALGGRIQVPHAGGVLMEVSLPEMAMVKQQLKTCQIPATDGDGQIIATDWAAVLECEGEAVHMACMENIEC